MSTLGTALKLRNLAIFLEQCPPLGYYRVTPNGSIEEHGNRSRDAREARPVNRLIAYLREQLILDFQGDLTIEMVREFLKEDDSREARLLLAKMVEDRGVNDMMLVLADCLLEHVQKALTDDIVREQLRSYSES